MTVAKLEPSSGGIDAVSTPTTFSPPTSPLTKEAVDSAPTTPAARTTSTTAESFAVSDKDSSSSKAPRNKHDDPDADPNAEKEPPRKLGPKMNPVYKGLRALVWALYFNLGATLISLTQVLSLPLLLIAPSLYHLHIKRTKGHFGAFLLKMNQLFAPSDFVLTGDKSVKDIVKVYRGGASNGDGTHKHGLQDILLDMPERCVFISNHQIYSDWMYLWCLSYFAEKQSALKIILRGDLTWIPVFGCGLFVCINKLRGSVEYLYDATVGYSGIHAGEIPQELYPLPGLYVDMAQPKDINVHLRRFAIKDIPETEPEFVEWMRTLWLEKDELMDEFYTSGKFPSQFTGEDVGDATEEGSKTVGRSLRIPLKSRRMLDYLSPSALNVIALPVLAYLIRYVLLHSS
ncbi:hypothetical protein BGZ98_007834 [Dissophora globulifera]|nr:hypothetical protein BGZ98_007834 [Dissophora globulifera]